MKWLTVLEIYIEVISVRKRDKTQTNKARLGLEMMFDDFAEVAEKLYRTFMQMPIIDGIPVQKHVTLTKRKSAQRRRPSSKRRLTDKHHLAFGCIVLLGIRPQY